MKYAELSTSRVKDYSFDATRMVALTGNTGVYLQYAHARIQSILLRARQEHPGRANHTEGTPNDAGTDAGFGAAGVDPRIALARPERALALQLDGFAATLTDVASELEPHRLCTYLYELARAFTAFYEECPVLKAEPTIRANRLALCQLTARTLHDGLELLGIKAPGRM